jgi:uncharacterized membrane protein YphA (DoxX/SURF4 family)
MPAATSQPGWVRAVLGWPGTWLLARLGLVSAYLVGGATKLFDFPGAIAEQAHFGLYPPQVWAVLAIVVELGGSVLILINRLVWLAAGGLAVLTLIATVVAEDFWRLQGHARFVAWNSFLEHIGLIAAFVLAAMITSMRPSISSLSR